MAAGATPEASLLDTGAGPVSVVFDGPLESPDVVVLAPGAGADMQHEFMRFVATELASSGTLVCRFNFPYAEAKKRRPDRQPVLEETYRSVVEMVQATAPDRSTFLAGKSMGGRIASHLAASGTRCAGLIFFGYPLHPPGRADRIRDAHLYGIEQPMLFVEGTRDPFCPLETLAGVRARIPVSTLAVIEDGDHSFKVRKSSGRTTKEAWGEAVDVSRAWVRAITGEVPF